MVGVDRFFFFAFSQIARRRSGCRIGDKKIRKEVERLIYILIRNLSRKFPRRRWTTYPCLRFVLSLATDKGDAFIRVPLVSSSPFLILTSLRRISFIGGRVAEFAVKSHLSSFLQETRRLTRREETMRASSLISINFALSPFWQWIWIFDSILSRQQLANR